MNLSPLATGFIAAGLGNLAEGVISGDLFGTMKQGVLNIGEDMLTMGGTFYKDGKLRQPTAWELASWQARTNNFVQQAYQVGMIDTLKDYTASILASHGANSVYNIGGEFFVNQTIKLIDIAIESTKKAANAISILFVTEDGIGTQGDDGALTIWEKTDETRTTPDGEEATVYVEQQVTPEELKEALENAKVEKKEKQDPTNQDPQNQNPNNNDPGSSGGVVPTAETLANALRQVVLKPTTGGEQFITIGVGIIATPGAATLIGNLSVSNTSTGSTTGTSGNNNNEPKQSWVDKFKNGVKKWSDILKGYTRHGLNQAISREGKGVDPKAILDAINDPVKIIKQSQGRIKYIGRHASIVLNSEGKVITAWGKPRIE